MRKLGSRKFRARKFIPTGDPYRRKKNSPCGIRRAWNNRTYSVRQYAWLRWHGRNVKKS